MVAVGSSILGVYDPIFYANEALIHLEKALGMATRVHRGFDSERKSFGRGQTINIRKPQSFVAQNAPSTAVGLDTDTIPLVLNNWKEVKFGIVDDELAFTKERIIEDHIAPAAYALANNVDQALVALTMDVGNSVAWGATDVVANITNARKAMFDAAVPLHDPTRLHMQLSGEMERLALSSSAFSQQQGAGDSGIITQMSGTLGRKYGFEVFANQNAGGENVGDGTYLLHGSHADNVGAINNGAGYAKGAVSIVVDGFTGSETIKANEPLKLLMDNGSAHYTTLTADVAFVSGAATLALNDALPSAIANNQPVQLLGTGASKATENGIAFHRNAFALAMAPLPEIAKELGAKVATITDAKTGLSIRSRVYYLGDSSEVHVALDILYGTKTLDSAMACRLERDVT